MPDPRVIAVLDVGKTNAKLALVDAQSLSEIAVVKRLNSVETGPPWPHFDLEGHWQFFLAHLAVFHRQHGIEAISVTTHGASAVLLDAEGHLAAPMLDYEHDGPDRVAQAYDRIRPAFTETGSPRLGRGLNLGAQLHWQFGVDPGLKHRTAHILTYPQYWGYRLTGVLASDVSSLGCHTDLWNPWKGEFSSLVERLGIAGKVVAPRRPFEVLGALSPEIAAVTGLPEHTPVSCGIHDSNASLLPYLLGHDAPFSVVSTGTWVICMAVGGDHRALDPARDTLVNVNAFGEPVPSARFMGGREFEVFCKGHGATPEPDDREAVLDQAIMLLPAIETGSGPFQGQRGHFSLEPENDGQRLVALSYYLALMTDTCLSLAGAKGPVIVEGPFAVNKDYCAMLAALRPDGVRVARSTTGTSVGSALLLLSGTPVPDTVPVPLANAARLGDYAGKWRNLTSRVQ